MINKGSRAGSGKKPHLRLLDLTFDNGVTKTEPQPKPHGGLRGMFCIIIKQHFSAWQTFYYFIQIPSIINKIM